MEKADKAKKIVAIAESTSSNKQNDVKCWQMYDSKFDDTDFSYLTELTDSATKDKYTYPAKMRWISVQRKYINLLVSQQSRRPWVQSTYAVDKKSLKDKYEVKMEDYLKKLELNIKDRYIALQAQLSELETQKANLQQIANSQPQTPEEQKAYEEAVKMIPMLLLQIERVKQITADQVELTTNDIEEIEKFHKYDYKDIYETSAQKIGVHNRIEYNMKRKSTENFKSHVVTGKEYYYVNVSSDGRRLDYYPVNELNVYHPFDPTVDFVQDGNWVAIKESMSFDQIMRLYGNVLTEEQTKRLKGDGGQHSVNFENRETFASTVQGGAVLRTDGKAELYAGSTSNETSIIRWRIWWIESRKARFKKSPNPYQKGKYFTHVIEENEKVDKSKGEQLIERSIDDRYYAIILQNDIVIQAGLDEIQIRDADDPSRNYLPVVGRTFADQIKQPYSLIWSTRDLQILYNIITWYKELIIALSGVKGQIVDLGQIPESMSPAEHRYYKKMGTLYIETVRKDGTVLHPSYNQWKDYDDTIPESVQYLDTLLNNIDYNIGMLMGITRQRLGEIVNTDQVGTAELARDQSALITEIIFDEHDEIERQANELALKLSIQYLYEAGGIFEILTSDLGNEIVNIPKGLFKEKQFKLVIADNSKQEQDMARLKQLALRQNELGLMPFNQLLKVFSINSITELERKLEYFSQEIEKQRQAMAQQQMQGQQQIEENKIRLAQEYENARFAEELKIKAADQQINAAKLEVDRQKVAVEEAIAREQMATDKALKTLEIASEREVETQYLGEQRRASMMDERIRALELRIEQLVNLYQLKQQSQKDKDDKQIKLKEVDVKDRQAKKTVKEHIKD